MSFIPMDRRRLLLPFTLTILCTLVLAFGDQAALLLRYDRPAILDGAVWRLLTGHLEHLGWPHLFMNLAGLWLLWLLYGDCMNDRLWAGMLAATGLGISAGLLVLDPKLVWYVGLSGILHGVFSCGIICRLRAAARGEWLMLTLLTAKLAWEQVNGSVPGSAEFAGGPVIVDAHLYGAIIGAVFGLLVPRGGLTGASLQTNMKYPDE
ncbi:MAG: rhombosortase [Gammaproteobacteria bacterium]|nr:rhombosortase [Gammaproteobacteria bacterium]